MERRGKNQKRCESLNLYFSENLNLGLKNEGGGGGGGGLDPRKMSFIWNIESSG